MTEECLTGTWVLAGGPGECFGCDEPTDPPDYRTPECDFADCVEADVDIFRDDGSAYAFIARWSDEARTVSVVLGCAVLPETWSVSPEGEIVRVTRRGTEGRIDAVCGPDDLIKADYMHWRRPPPGPAAALAAMPEQVVCTAVPYEP